MWIVEPESIHHVLQGASTKKDSWHTKEMSLLFFSSHLIYFWHSFFMCPSFLQKKQASLLWRPFFFLKKKENIQTDHHSGTTCRSANIWYTSHNMYLIFRVTSMQRNINNIIRIAESTSIIITVNHKRAIYKSICLRLLKHINLITYQKIGSTKIQMSRRTRANNKRLPNGMSKST
jgi:CxxC motif-containing protein